MQIVYIHQYFTTPEEGGATRSYHIAGHWASLGHKVYLITAHNKTESAIRKVNGFEVHYLQVPYKQSFGTVKRMMAFIRFAIQAFFYAVRFKGTDLVYATSTPLTVGITALLLKKFKKWPYIFEVRDPWPDIPVKLNILKKGLFTNVLYRLEKRIYQNAHHIITLSPDSQQLIQSKIRGKTVKCIPNFARPALFNHQTGKVRSGPEPYPLSDKIMYPSEKRALKANQDTFIITYIGSMGYVNGLENILWKAKHLQEHHVNAEFRMVGDGSHRHHLINQARKYHLNNIVFWPWMSQQDTFQILNNADAVYVSFLPEAILNTVSPNKFYDGLAAGKTIITTLTGWMKTVIEENECGFHVDFYNNTDFKEKVMPLLQSRETNERYKQNALKLAYENYEISDLLKNLDDVVFNS